MDFGQELGTYSEHAKQNRGVSREKPKVSTGKGGDEKRTVHVVQR
jgi:hypothetical protein